MNEKKYLIILSVGFVVHIFLMFLNVPKVRQIYGIAAGCVAVYYSLKGVDLKKWERWTILIVGIALIVT